MEPIEAIIVKALHLNYNVQLEYYHSYDLRAMGFELAYTIHVCTAHHKVRMVLVKTSLLLHKQSICHRCLYPFVRFYN